MKRLGWLGSKICTMPTPSDGSLSSAYCWSSVLLYVYFYFYFFVGLHLCIFCLVTCDMKWCGGYGLIVIMEWKLQFLWGKLPQKIQFPFKGKVFQVLVSV